VARTNVGRRTNHWDAYRFDSDPTIFGAAASDGLGDDWPIGYTDLKPYYDSVDRLIGVFGSIESLPNDPDGIFPNRRRAPGAMNS